MNVRELKRWMIYIQALYISRICREEPDTLDRIIINGGMKPSRATRARWKRAANELVERYK